MNPLEELRVRTQPSRTLDVSSSRGHELFVPDRWFAVLLLAFVACMATAHAFAADSGAVVICARRILIGNGDVIENGQILVEKGRIVAIAPQVEAPISVPRLHIDGGTVTPGLIDANARLESYSVVPTRSRPAAAVAAGTTREREPEPEDASHDSEQDHAGHSHPPTPDLARPGQGNEIASDYSAIEDLSDDCCQLVDSSLPSASADEAFASGVGPGWVVTDQTAEVAPHNRVIDSLDLSTLDLTRLVRGGVTTVYVSPDSSAVIGARGAIVRTAGADPVVREAGAVKATIGSDPIWLGTRNSSLFFAREAGRFHRRPTSAMGVTWVFRKAFFDAQRRAQGLPVGGADTPSPEALDVLGQILAGEVELRIQARRQVDILTAFRLAAELGLRFTLEEATEAYLCLDEIQAAGSAVVFGPIFERATGIRRFSTEADRSRFHTFGSLLARGIPTALSAQELRDEDGLVRQGMVAMRFGSSEEDVLRALTETPAKLLGIDDVTGTLAVGKRADLVVWTGAPFSATSRPALVMVGGETVWSTPEAREIEVW